MLKVTQYAYDTAFVDTESFAIDIESAEQFDLSSDELAMLVALARLEKEGQHFNEREFYEYSGYDNHDFFLDCLTTLHTAGLISL
ncbi:hypothetical protein SAMN05421503_1493 [Terribacillus aidingensis]|uniref:Uncharacterized protein n=1 Tax=Terribacillus aidingensis TaxID=586416 RepID=A0A285NLD0_9BACI|nr:hypothetical protein [Terribacillus aidingensis]SNZ10038.1 hypothetical protein SAMN05421503_1493 [Terribacillus aidingensis]